MKRWIWGLLAFLACLLLLTAGTAQEAQELTKQCKFRAGGHRSKFSACLDRDYGTYWASGGGADKACIEVTLPEGQTCGYVMLKWYDHPHAYSVRVQDEHGSWVEIRRTEGLYLADALALPEGITRFRITNVGKKTATMHLAELYVYGAGDCPAPLQLWTPPASKADLLLIVAHPDDEVLWFGGTLPYYAGERGKTVQVALMTTNVPKRRLELLDGLWLCKVRHYPVWGGFSDSFGATLQKMYKHWSKNRVYRTVVGWVRQFRPEVLLTHDVRGEYGHGAHKVCADAVQYALKAASDETKYTESAKAYGVWDVPKCYLHLWPENVLKMDWRRPLSAFDGQTGFDVALAAFGCHVSQQRTDYHVEDWGPYDNSLFGLVRSRVGEDTAGDDFFEHLAQPAAEQAENTDAADPAQTDGSEDMTEGEKA